jgi:hypothetical protein
LIFQDDEENSTEPPLVIDESEDFELNERPKPELLCQGCKRTKAMFMCAGCSRQWYCSKECQVIYSFAFSSHQLTQLNINYDFSQLLFPRKWRGKITQTHAWFNFHF